MEIVNWDEFLMPYTKAVDELVLKFRGMEKEFKLLEQHSPIEYVEGRVKRIGSILDKANRKNIAPGEIEEKIEDIAGVRIICKFVEDIERVIALMRQRDGVDIRIKEERDYINHTKPSGYRSYHMLIQYSVITSRGAKDVRVELQIRTMAMNFWATIEHSIKYKYNGNIPDDLQRRLIKSAEAAFMLDKEMSKIRGEILEVQKVIQKRNDLVDQILQRINNLYFGAKLDKIDEINREFFELYESGNIDRLAEFNQQLKVMADMYKVQYV